MGLCQSRCCCFWAATAIGHESDLLPVPHSEYLALEAMAFERSLGNHWRFPAAMMELENRQEVDVIAYSPCRQLIITWL